VAFAGCDQEDSLKLDSGAAYFPLKKGVYQVYGVNEVHYSATAQPEEFVYELRSEVIDSFPSTAGDYTYVIERSTRLSAAQPWQVAETWSARKDKSQVVVSEGNTSFVKISFPVRAETRWNGNALNTLGEDVYEVKRPAQPWELGGLTFGKTVTIEQESNADKIVYNDQRVEVYASNVGLIYKEITQLNYCTDDHCLGQQRIDEGFEMKMAIKEYGGY
jgi:hypothetical protein